MWGGKSGRVAVRVEKIAAGGGDGAQAATNSTAVSVANFFVFAQERLAIWPVWATWFHRDCGEIEIVNGRRGEVGCGRREEVCAGRRLVASSAVTKRFIDGTILGGRFRARVGPDSILIRGRAPGVSRSSICKSIEQ